MTFLKKLSIFAMGTGLLSTGLLTSGQAFAVSDPISNVTAQDLNQNISTYIGKTVKLTGRVDRVLGNGSYIIADAGNSQDPSHRVLIFTSQPASNKMLNGKQQAGTAAANLKEGDTVLLNGKAEEFNVSNEVDTFSPKSDRETINESAMTLPVLVIQPGNIQKG